MARGQGGGNPMDLLGLDGDSFLTPEPVSYAPNSSTGRTVDLSGGSSLPPPRYPDEKERNGAGVGSSSSNGFSNHGFGSNNSENNGYSNSNGFGNNSFGSNSRGPTSIEGGAPELNLLALNPSALLRELTTKPISAVAVDQTRQLMQVPRMAYQAYNAVARRYMRPWNEFIRLNPVRIIEGLRGARRRGEVQIYLQRNVLANAQHFLPNYMFMFMAALFMFVCTSPMLLVMLAGVGGSWGHALRSDDFRNKPWTLAIGGVQLPLGANAKMAAMSVPTLFFLHFFMGPVLWSAALCTGGVSVAHAALKDRQDRNDNHRDGNDHWGGGGGGGGGGFSSSSSSSSSVRIHEVP